MERRFCNLLDSQFVPFSNNIVQDTGEINESQSTSNKMNFNSSFSKELPFNNYCEVPLSEPVLPNDKLIDSSIN